MDAFSPALTPRRRRTTSPRGIMRAQAGEGNSSAQPTTGRPLRPLHGCRKKVEFDLSLQNPNCVFQLLKKHYSRYTPEMVERITGIPKEQFLKAAELYTSIRKDGDMKKAGRSFTPSDGRSTASARKSYEPRRYCNCFFGNVGRAAVASTRCRALQHSGCHRHGRPFRFLPGYLKVPTPADTSFDSWRNALPPHPPSPPLGIVQLLWQHAEIAVSYLKALFGTPATKQNGWAFDYLPRKWIAIFVGADVGRHVQRECERHACLLG